VQSIGKASISGAYTLYLSVKMEYVGVAEDGGAIHGCVGQSAQLKSDVFRCHRRMQSLQSHINIDVVTVGLYTNQRGCSNIYTF